MISKLRVVLIAMSLSATAFSPLLPAQSTSNVPQTIVTPSGQWMTLKFHDEFNAVPDQDGQPYIDRSKWQTTFWQGSSERCLFGNLEAQYYTDKDYGGANHLPVAQRLNPFSFPTPGNLTISAWRVPTNLWKNFWMGDERCFASGLLISDRRFDFQYRSIKDRFKLSASRGAWPAFWLLGNDSTQTNQDQAHAWPPEIDIFEFFGHRPTKHSAGIIVKPGAELP